MPQREPETRLGYKRRPTTTILLCTSREAPAATSIAFATFYVHRLIAIEIARRCVQLAYEIANLSRDLRFIFAQNDGIFLSLDFLNSININSLYGLLLKFENISNIA